MTEVISTAAFATIPFTKNLANYFSIGLRAAANRLRLLLVWESVLFAESPARHHEPIYYPPRFRELARMHAR